MEAFGVIGMSMGSTGFVFALIAFANLGAVKKELDDLKQTLRDAGVLDA
jgi:hypothetical protein